MIKYWKIDKRKRALRYIFWTKKSWWLFAISVSTKAFHSKFPLTTCSRPGNERS